MPKVERIDAARMDRLERVELERRNVVLERLDRIVDRIGKLEPAVALVLAHVSTARLQGEQFE